MADPQPQIRDGANVSDSEIPQRAIYPFSLSDGQMAYLDLPTNLTVVDAERLAKMVATLPLDWPRGDAAAPPDNDAILTPMNDATFPQNDAVWGDAAVSPEPEVDDGQGWRSKTEPQYPERPPPDPSRVTTSAGVTKKKRRRDATVEPPQPETPSERDK